MFKYQGMVLALNLSEVSPQYRTHKGKPMPINNMSIYLFPLRVLVRMW